MSDCLSRVKVTYKELKNENSNLPSMFSSNRKIGSAIQTDRRWTQKKA